MKSRASESVIDVSGIYDEESLHEYLWKKLDFPGYYGCNWNAFWDCICSDEQSSMPVVLRVAGLSDLCKFAPESAKQFEICLSDYADSFPERSVIVQ